jgi:hypothetical protein
MEILSVNFIHLLDLTRNSCEKCNYKPSGRRTNGTIRPIWQEEKWNYTSYLAGGKMEL